MHHLWGIYKVVMYSWSKFLARTSKRTKVFQEVLANLNKDTLTQIPLTSQFSCRFDPSEPGPGCPMTVDAEVLQGQRVQVLLIVRVGKNSKESRFESKKLTIDWESESLQFVHSSEISWNFCKFVDFFYSIIAPESDKLLTSCKKQCSLKSYTSFSSVLRYVPFLEAFYTRWNPSAPSLVKVGPCFCIF